MSNAISSCATQVDEFNRIRAVAYTMRNTVMGLSRDTNVPGQLKAALQVLEERGLVREDVFYDDMASSVYGLQTAKVVAGLYEELGWEMHPKVKFAYLTLRVAIASELRGFGPSGLGSLP